MQLEAPVLPKVLLTGNASLTVTWPLSSAGLRSVICLAVAFLFLPPEPSSCAAAPALAEFDFTQPAVVQQWQPQHHISSLRHTPEGLEVTLSGNDPYFAGPARDYP